jgi:hypothetical protein
MKRLKRLFRKRPDDADRARLDRALQVFASHVARGEVQCWLCPEGKTAGVHAHRSILDAATSRELGSASDEQQAFHYALCADCEALSDAEGRARARMMAEYSPGTRRATGGCPPPRVVIGRDEEIPSSLS